MDDLNNAFNWRWMLDSVQPQGPTGGSVGALFKDMRDSMKGGPGGNVDKAFAMNKALRDENVAYGNSLGDLEKENDKHNLAWANFENTKQGRVNADNRNILDAEKQYTAAPDEGSRQFWANRIKLLDPQNAESRIATLEGMRVETQKQNKLGKETLAKYSGRFKNKNDQDAAIAEVTKLYEEGDENGVKLNTDDYTKIVQAINGKLDLNTERSITAGNMRSNDNTQKQIKKSDAEKLAELVKKAPADYLSDSSRKKWAREQFYKKYGYAAPEDK